MKKQNKRSGASTIIVVLVIIFLAGLLFGLLGESVQEPPLPTSPAEAPLHPYFTVSKTDILNISGTILDELSGIIPDPDKQLIITAIAEHPETFLEYLAAMIKEPDQMFFALVDKQHAIAENFVPAGLRSLNDYPSLTLNRNDLSLQHKVIVDLLDMVEAAKNDGITLLISSTYRSYSYQEQLFQRHVDERGLERAERISARAGTSQHQLGTTLDFGLINLGFAADPAGIWLAQNAWEFGFSLSYPQNYEEVTGYDYEPWHYRHLGKHAVYLQQIFFSDIQQYMLLFYDKAYSLLEKLRK